MTAPTLNDLSDRPAHFPDTCPALSKPLFEALVNRIPLQAGTALSIGCGHGLFEALLLQQTRGQLDLYGVEVATCRNKYISDDRMKRVPTTTSLYPDAVLSTLLIFVYPRDPKLVKDYIETCRSGALERLVWFSHRTDWPQYEKILLSFFFRVELVENVGIASYELLVIASMPRTNRPQPA